MHFRQKFRSTLIWLTDVMSSPLRLFSNHWWLCPRDINLFFPHLISPLTLTNLVMGCFDFSSLSNPLPVALHDGQAQYCAWHLQPALVGSSFPSSVVFNLMSVTRTSSKNWPFLWNFLYCIHGDCDFYMRFCFGSVKLLFVIWSTSKSLHKERQILWHFNVVYYLLPVRQLLLFISNLTDLYFVNIYVYCLYCLTTLDMLALNLAFGWSNLTPIESLLKR